MKVSKISVTAVFYFICLFSFSQGEFIIEIDRATGSYVKTGPAIGGITYIYPDDRAFDESTGTFIFPSSLVAHRLYSIDVTNDSTVHSPLINNIFYFQFDNATGTLYGLEQDNANNQKNFISIDPASGVYTPLGSPVPGSSLFSGAFSAYDKLNHVYYFLDPPNRLYSIDALTGNVLANPPLVLAPGENIYHFASSSGTLYGLLHDNSIATFFLVTIDPLTGTITRIGPGTISGTGTGSSAIDEASHQYIYLYSGSGYYGIITMDLVTGAMIYCNTIPLALNDNVFSLQYDNVNQKLYSIHWDDEITTAGLTENDHRKTLRAYPQPFFAEVTIAAPVNMQNACMVIYNAEGQVVREIKNISGREITLKREDLAAGLYYYLLTEGGSVIGSDKLTITD